MPPGPVRPYELEVAVERLLPRLDLASATSASAATATRSGWRERILEIVAERGKMHNPDTDSGGDPARDGRPPSASASASRRASAPGSSTLGSLTLTPLRLDAVTGARPRLPAGGGRGHRLRLRARRLGARCPTTCRSAIALEHLRRLRRRVAGARRSLPAAGTVCVLGAGHAGKLALAAARDGEDGGTLVAIDVDAEAVERVARARPLRRRRHRRPARPARGARGGARRGRRRPPT